MQKNTKIILIICISILAITAIVLGTILVVRNNQKPEEETPQGEVITGEGGDIVDEDFYNVEVELNEKLVKMFQEVNKEDYATILHEGEARRIAVKEIMDIYHIDMTEYEPYNCDYTKSYVEIDMVDGNLIYGSFLACDWPKPNIVEPNAE